LKAWRVTYVRGPRLVPESRQRPDFLFSSCEANEAGPEKGDIGITILRAKSTCKVRWMQVLTEASKISTKHLLTLEPGISESQTHEIMSTGLQLVVPQAIHNSYSDSQQDWLLNLRDFIRLVVDRELRFHSQ